MSLATLYQILGVMCSFDLLMQTEKRMVKKRDLTLRTEGFVKFFFFFLNQQSQGGHSFSFSQKFVAVCSGRSQL